MTSISKIERAIEQLGPDDLAAFRDWFERFEAEGFDRRITDDAASGRLDQLADEALADLRRGDVRDL